MTKLRHRLWVSTVTNSYKNQSKNEFQDEECGDIAYVGSHIQNHLQRYEHADCRSKR